MAAKKYYAVRKGKKTGLFHTWEACRESVEGCPGAEYRGFARLEEAESYLGLAPGAASVQGQMPGSGGDGSGDRPCGRGGAGGKAAAESAAGLPGDAPAEVPEEGTLLAYVDGSFDASLKKYAFGCVFLLPDGQIRTEYGNGDNEQSLQHRNVTGEMLGAMFAVRTAMLSGFSKVEIRYDYEGIEKWVTGAWRSKTELTRKYAMSMRQWGGSIEIRFTKVAAHSNVYYNELADKMAKTGLREGDGIPKVRSLVQEQP